MHAKGEFMPRQYATRLRSLLAAVVAVAVFGVHPSHAAVLTREAAAAELQTLPLFKVLAQHYPDTYDQMLTKLVEDVNKGRRLQDITAELKPIYVNLLGQQLPKANVENSQAMLRLVIDQAKAAEAIDPQLCLSLLGVAQSTDSLEHALPQELVTKEQALAAKLFEQAATAPEAPPKALSSAQLEKIAFQAYDALPGDQLRAAIRAIDGDPKKAATPIQQTAFCEFSIAMLESIGKLPPIEGAQAFKGFMAYK